MGLFDPGKGARRQAKRFGRQGVFTGGGFTGPGGGFAGFDFTNNRLSGDLSLGGDFQNLLTGFQGLSQAGLDQAGSDIPESLRNAGAGAIEGLNFGGIDRLTQEQDFAGFGDVFQSSLDTAQADPFELGAGISEKLRALSERRNQRGVNKMFDRLRSTGNLGSSAGIARAGDLERNIFEQGLQFDLAGLKAGQGIQQDAFGRLLGSSGSRGQIGSRDFGEQFAEEQLRGDRTLQQFGIENSLFDSFLRNQAQGAGIAGGAAGVSQNIQGIPLQLMQALLASGTTASNSIFQGANVFNNAAALSNDPFAEAINAAGGLAAGIGRKPTP